MSRYFRPLSVLLFIAAIPSVYSQQATREDSLRAAREEAALRGAWTITAAECQAYVQRLAGPEFDGRATGTEGFRKTAAFVAEEFKKSGLKPAVGDTSYFQHFTLSVNRIVEPLGMQLLVLIPRRQGKGQDTLSVRYTSAVDYVPAGFAGTAKVTAPGVFVGYGIASKENRWDDYAGADLKGKIALALGGTPAIEGLKWDYDWGRSLRKAQVAREHGALGLLVVTGANGSISREQLEGFPVMHVSEKVGDDLLKGTGQTVDSLRKRVQETKRPLALPLKLLLQIQTTAKFYTDQPTMNVIGVVEGSDPRLKDEVIILGAHADHLGRIGNDVYYGANDNASGTATLLELAEAFGTGPEKPKRTLLFIAFAGEEMGLVGSEYYVHHPVFPLEKTVAMINLDVVGSGQEGIMVVAGETFPKFYDLVKRIDERFIHRKLASRPQARNSDHFHFGDKGIPAIFLYAMGGTAPWHSPRDLPEGLDPEAMETIGRLVFLVANEIANAEAVHLKPEASP